MVEVVEHFPRERVPSRVACAIHRFIQHTPASYFFGLGKVVLTNSTTLPSERKKRARRVGKRVLGIYHRSWQGQPARIEMYIDNIRRQYPAWVLHVPVLCDQLLGEVFFHELGHHLHRTQRPEYKDGEQVAEQWAKKLLAGYMRQKYWYLKILSSPYLLIRWLRRHLGGPKQDS